VAVKPAVADVAAIVQARMSSQRFPGKVLATFKGRPVLDHVLDAVEAVVPPRDVTIATSVETSDDPIVEFARRRGTRVTRGALANVLARLQGAAAATEAEWILRINADSPLLDPHVIRLVIEAARPDVDVVSTTQPRTFPKGRNAELIRRSVFLAVDASAATAAEREHVTQYFYQRPHMFRIHNVSSGHPDWADTSLAVDTPADLAQLEEMTARQLARFSLNTP
jgi:spore coat polysaccharide biosynthesis protein SpsF